MRHIYKEVRPLVGSDNGECDWPGCKEPADWACSPSNLTTHVYDSACMKHKPPEDWPENPDYSRPREVGKMLDTEVKWCLRMMDPDTTIGITEEMLKYCMVRGYLLGVNHRD